jgi:UDP:flavonoid glycosyltransferase YjiC (YdhE family)
MSRVLIYTSPARGHLYPIMDVALGLRGAGHEVCIQTLADEHERVRGEGIEHRSIAGAIEALPLEDYRGSNPLAAIRSTFGSWLARAPHEAEDLRVSVAEFDPALVLVDANSWGAAAFAEARKRAEGRPWALFMPFCLPVPSPDTPAFGPGFAPPRNGLERTRDRLVTSATNLATRDRIAALNGLRAQLGASRLHSYADVFTGADALLYRTAEPFEYPRRCWPPGTHAIGPGLWAPPGEAPAWLDGLPRPRVLVNVSTELQEDGAIIEAALAALADEPGSVIVTTAALDPSRFVPSHDRVRIARFLPHAAVIPKVDLVITHGGMGSTQRALSAGVPVVVVPWGRDQAETARRVELCGAGVQVPRARLSVAQLRAAIAQAWNCKAGAEAVARGFAAAGGARRGVEVLESLM